MPVISNTLKAELGEILAKWYLKFGKVKPRRRYEDEDEGGSGSAAFVFEEHPLLTQLPQSAPSDLSYVVMNDTRTINEAKDRIEESSPELQNTLSHALGMKKERKLTKQMAPRPTPA